MLQISSKAAHDRPFCSMSGGVVGFLKSILAARRLVTTAYTIPSGVVSTKMLATALRLSVGGKMKSSKPVAILAKSTTRSSWASSSEPLSDG